MDDTFVVLVMICAVVTSSVYYACPSVYSCFMKVYILINNEIRDIMYVYEAHFYSSILGS